MASYTFDPEKDTVSPEQMQAEQDALQQGEVLAQAEQEDRARRTEQIETEQEDVALIGGKFKSQDDLLKAYEELQRKMSSGEKEEPSEEPTEAAEEAPEAEEVEEVVTPEAITRASELFNKEGKLDEASIDELSKMDTRELIEAYVNFYSQAQSEQAQAEISAEQVKSVQAIAGGEQGYGELMQWASSNLDASEIDAFNNVANSGNVAALRFAVEALSNRRVSAEGYEAPLVSGRKAASGVQGYRSQAELARDIADPRYASDPAFRMDVENKLMASGDLL